MRDNAATRLLAAAAIASRGRLRLSRGALYPGLSDITRAYRICDRSWIRGFVSRRIADVTRRCLEEDVNPVVESFFRSGAAEMAAHRYSLGGEGDLDLFRDVMVLKVPRGDEKGVVVLKYSETFDAFAAYYDVRAVASKFRIVLEPSWAGYCDPTFLMYVMPDQPVLVQCFTEEDEEFITELKANLHPVALGPADWVPTDVFAEDAPTEKKFDVVMVANWGRHKQHRKLFEALRTVPYPIRVLLVGFPWAGRTQHDILRDARIVDPQVTITIEEKLDHSEVAERMRQSRVLVFLSKKEGDNKAVVEGLFSDVPALVFEDSVGGARSRINDQTGVLTSYRDLGPRLFEMLGDLARFSPRSWALAHTGSARATATLEDSLQSLAASRGEPFTTGIAEKANAPNLTYTDATQEDFGEGYRLLSMCRR